MSPILCNPFKKNNKIVPCLSPKKYNKQIPTNLNPSNTNKNPFHSNITHKKNIKPDNYDNYDNNTIEKIYIQLLDNEKRLKRLNFYIDRLDEETKNKMDILYEIEKKIDLYDLKFNKILHIR